MRRALVAAAVLGAWGCDRTVGTLVLTFKTSPNVTDERPLPTGEAAEGVTIEVRVEGPGIAVSRRTTAYVPGDTHLLVPGVDVGPDRIFTVTARNERGDDLARARSLPFDMSGDDESLELYLSRVGEQSETQNTMASPRFRHTATPLPDGRILLAGGGGAVVTELDEDDRSVSSLVVPADPVPYAEIFDPTNAKFVTDPPNCERGLNRTHCLLCERMGQVAGVDVDGAPLLAGGEPACRLNSAERFAEGRFEAGADIGNSLAEQASFDTPLGVVIAGGLDLTTGEPSTQALLVTGAEAHALGDGLHQARYGAAGAPLPDGGGIIVGGFVSWSRKGSTTECVCPQGPCQLAHPEALDCRARGEVTGSIEIYDPETRTFEEIEDVLVVPRAFATATALPDGRVVILGGLGATLGIGGQNLPTSTIEIFDPRSGTVCRPGGSTVGNLRQELFLHAAVAAATGPDDNRVIVAGGYFNNIGAISSGIEVVRVGAGCQAGVLGEFLAKPLRIPRAGHTLTRMANGAFLIAGGATTEGVTDVADVLWLE